MKDLFLMLWGAFLTSVWWGYGIYRYHGIEPKDFPLWFSIPFFVVTIGSFLTLIFIILVFGSAIRNSWNDSI